MGGGSQFVNERGMKELNFYLYIYTFLFFTRCFLWQAVLIPLIKFLTSAQSIKIFILLTSPSASLKPLTTLTLLTPPCEPSLNVSNIIFYES